MADVSKLYKGVWRGAVNPEQAALQASDIYTRAAEQADESACFKGGVTYGDNGAAVSASFSTYRQCGRSFGALVAKPSKNPVAK